MSWFRPTSTGSRIRTSSPRISSRRSSSPIKTPATSGCRSAGAIRTWRSTTTSFTGRSSTSSGTSLSGRPISTSLGSFRSGPPAMSSSSASTTAGSSSTRAPALPGSQNYGEQGLDFSLANLTRGVRLSFPTGVLDRHPRRRRVRRRLHAVGRSPLRSSTRPQPPGRVIRQRDVRAAVPDLWGGLPRSARGRIRRRRRLAGSVRRLAAANLGHVRDRAEPGPRCCGRRTRATWISSAGLRHSSSGVPFPERLRLRLERRQCRSHRAVQRGPVGFSAGPLRGSRPPDAARPSESDRTRSSDARNRRSDTGSRSGAG